MREEMFSRAFSPSEIEEGHYNAEQSRGGVNIKEFTERNEPPIRRMERQHLPLGHADRLSYEERMYRFFRDYRSDIEHGRVATDNETYHRVNVYTHYYKELFLGEASVNFDGIYSVPVDITAPESLRAFKVYYWGKTEEERELAHQTLLRYTKPKRVNSVTLYYMEQAGILGDTEARA